MHNGYKPPVMDVVAAELLGAGRPGGGISTAKVVREWLGLGISAFTPVAIFLATQWFSRQATKRNRETERERQQDAVVADYIDAMKSLIVEHDLRRSEADSDVAVMARTLTLTALSRLRSENKGSQRKAEILQFLHEAGLIARTP